ncbi:MAG: efflux RND transporter periplasmic adaptor subunit [Bacteroidetes bacterium]|nr:efflux RND transporter periplasmic adaptor subunit [Bacteroidota bacterium]
MNKKKSIIKLHYLILIIAILLAACSSPEQNAVTTNEHTTEREGLIHLSPEQQKAIGLTTGEIIQRNLKTSLKVNGKLMLPPQNQAQVSLLVGGIVKDILVQEGALVNKGQVLATIENIDFIQIQQDYLQSKSTLVYLKAEFERQKELQKENINAGKTFQKAESDYIHELSNHNALKQKLSFYNTDANILNPDNIRSTFNVLAPIAGNIHTITINIGKFAEPNKELFDIVDNRYLHIDLTVFEKDISKIHEGQKLTFTDANDPGHLHNATIFSVNKAFEDDQQAVIAHAKIDHVSATLLPGMFIEARINIDSNTTATLPSIAIVNNGDEHYIFVETKSGEYKQVAIRMGASDQGWTEVIPLQTLDEKSRVVMTGAYYLLSELTKGEGEHHD